jgi:hypothetical protein
MKNCGVNFGENECFYLYFPVKNKPDQQGRYNKEKKV